MKRKTRYRMEVTVVSGLVFLFVFFLNTHNPPTKKPSHSKNIPEYQSETTAEYVESI